MGLIAVLVNIVFVVGLAVALGMLLWKKVVLPSRLRDTLSSADLDELAFQVGLGAVLVSFAVFYALRFEVVDRYYVPPTMGGLVVVEWVDREVRVTPAPYGVWRANFNKTSRVRADLTGGEWGIRSLTTVSRLSNGTPVSVRIFASIEVENLGALYKEKIDANPDTLRTALRMAAAEATLDEGWPAIVQLAFDEGKGEATSHDESLSSALAQLVAKHLAGVPGTYVRAGMAVVKIANIR